MHGRVLSRDDAAARGQAEGKGWRWRRRQYAGEQADQLQRRERVLRQRDLQLHPAARPGLGELVRGGAHGHVAHQLVDHIGRGRPEQLRDRPVLAHEAHGAACARQHVALAQILHPVLLQVRQQSHTPLHRQHTQVQAHLADGHRAAPARHPLAQDRSLGHAHSESSGSSSSIQRLIFVSIDSGSSSIRSSVTGSGRAKSARHLHQAGEQGDDARRALAQVDHVAGRAGDGVCRQLSEALSRPRPGHVQDDCGDQGLQEERRAHLHRRLQQEAQPATPTSTPTATIANAAAAKTTTTTKLN